MAAAAAGPGRRAGVPGTGAVHRHGQVRAVPLQFAHAFALALQRIQAELNLSVTPFEVLEEPPAGGKPPGRRYRGNPRPQHRRHRSRTDRQRADFPGAPQPRRQDQAPRRRPQSASKARRCRPAVATPTGPATPGGIGSRAGQSVPQRPAGARRLRSDPADRRAAGGVGAVRTVLRRNDRAPGHRTMARRSPDRRGRGRTRPTPRTQRSSGRRRRTSPRHQTGQADHGETQPLARESPAEPVLVLAIGSWWA